MRLMTLSILLLLGGCLADADDDDATVANDDDSAPDDDDSADDDDASENSPPIADAGPDATYGKADAITLDGTGSSDPDNDPLTAVWTQTAGADNAAITPNAISPSLSGLCTGGVYTFELVVNDGIVDSAPDSVELTLTNLSPTADAGADQVAGIGAQVVLNGAGSSDPDLCDVLTYSWTQTSGPTVGLSDPAAAQLSFDAPGTAASLVFELVVSDGEATSTADSVTINVVSNVPPVADAGPDASYNKEEQVTLDGNGTFDPDGDPITPNWTQTAGPAVATLDDPNSLTPIWLPGCVSGVWTFELSVEDGVNTSTDSVDITIENRPPQADAGNSRSVAASSLVTLDGGGSSDGDACDSITSVLWSQTGGATVVLSSDTAEAPTFVAPAFDDVLTFHLEVSDGVDTDTASVSITVANQPPVAEAGADQNSTLGSTVILDGTGSSDPESSPLTYAWSFVTGPTPVTLADPTTPVQSVTLPGTVGGVFVFALVVNDGQLDSAEDRVRVTVPGSPPTADAGPDQEVNGGELVKLDGGGSDDPDGDALTFQWTQIGGPTVQIGDGVQPRLWFQAPGSGGALTFELAVDDGTSTDVDTVTIQSQAWSGTPIDLPPTPFSTTFEPFTLRTFDVSISDDVAAVMGNESSGIRLRMFDVAVPEAPVELASTATLATNQAVFDGSHVFVTTTLGVEVFAWNPTGPSLQSIGTAPLPPGFTTLGEPVLAGGYLFGLLFDTGTGDEGFAAYDVSVPANPQLLYSQAFDGAKSLAARDGELWIGHFSGSLHAFDTAGLSNLVPTVVELTDPADDGCSDIPWGLNIDGDTLFAACDDAQTLAIFDISDPAEPSLRATVTAPGNAQSVELLGDLAFVAASNAGLHEIDVSDLDNPVWLGTHPLSQDGQQMATTSLAVFIAVGGEAIDVVRPGAALPGFAATFGTTGSVRHLDWDLGYLGVGLNNGAQLVDALDPEALVLAAPVSQSAFDDLRLEWPLLLASGGNAGVAILDTAVPTAPALLATFGINEGYSTRQMHVVDDVLYLTTQSDGLQIVDLSNPSAPASLGEYDVGQGGGPVFARDDVCYASSYANGIDVLDVSDPASPLPLAFVPHTSPSGPLELSGGQLFNGFGATGFYRWDVSDPANPGPGEFIDLSGAPKEIRVNGALAWAAIGGAGLVVVDVSDVSDPRIIERHGVLDTAEALALGDDYVFVGDGSQVHSVPIDNAVWTARHVEAGPPGAVATWSVSWQQPTDDEQLRCFVDAGTCAVFNVNLPARTADVQWTLPAAGDHEIAVVIGHPATHAILRDRVTVTN